MDPNAKLAYSRNKFFALTGTPDANFWVYLLQRLGTDLPDHYSQEDMQEYLSWRPNRSNCPELDGVMARLLDDFPPAWKELAGELFVGRVIDPEVNATASTHFRARVITLNLQFTNALAGYVTAYDEQQLALMAILNVQKADDGDPGVAIQEIVDRFGNRYWKLLEEALADMSDPSQVVGIPGELHTGTREDRAEYRDDLVLAAETWVICHEIAHHLLKHTVSRRENAPARGLIDGVKGLFDTADLSPEQVDELDADILAFLMTAGIYDLDAEASFGGLYRAQMGATISLITLAHVHETWVLPEDHMDTHPDFLRRYEVIRILTRRFAAGRPRADNGGHPLDLLIDLLGFVSVALNSWLNRLDPQHHPLDLLTLFDHLLNEKERLGADFAAWASADIPLT